MVDIPEQAVQAAIRGYASSKQHTFDGQIHDALTAAAPYMSGVKVKQLDWSDLFYAEDYKFMRSAGTSIGRYVVVDGGWFLQGQTGWERADSIESAKAAAQADYEKRILSALEPYSTREQALEEAETQGNLKQWNIQDHLKTPGSIAEYLQATLDEGDSDLLINAVSDIIRAFKSQPSSAREQALEEAAKALDDLIDYWRSLPTFNRSYAMRSTIKVASDLRALKSQPAPSPQSLVIIESPYAGDIAANESYARACLLDCLRRGEAPIASHLLHTQVLDDMQPDERELGIEAGLAWYRVADKCVVYADRGVSGGMAKGIKRANRYGVPVEYRTLSEGQVAQTGGGK